MSVAYEEPRVFQPGERFRQHPFSIEAFLGEGASGQVYAIRHLFTGDAFALKVGHLKKRGNAKEVARSLNEGRATYTIRHPNVVTVHDLGCEEDGLVWQRMELLEGSSLGTTIDRHRALSPLYAIDVALEVAAGLQAAHDRQIIHRDVHPFNVFLCDQGRVKVLDFSLAKVIPSGLQTTHGSRFMGTEGYMAPEYLKGRVVTPQLDVYALGMLLWEMLAGHHAFRAPGMSMMALVRRSLEEDPPSLVTAARLPAYCDEVIRGATARDPAQRYAGMWGLMQGLQALRARLVGDPEATAVVMQKRWERRHPIGPVATGYAQQAELAKAPALRTAPPLASRRVVVAGEVASGEESRRVVSKTVPMGVAAPVAVGAVGGGGPGKLAATVNMVAPMVPAGMTASGVDVGAPTVRGRDRPRSGRGLVLAVLIAVMLIATGVTAWVLVGAESAGPTRAPARAAGPSSPTTLPRAGR